MPKDPFDDEGQETLFKADLKGASAAGLEGEYILVAAGIREDISEAGNDMWVIDFEVVSDLEGGVDSAGQGLPLFLAQTPAAMWKTEEFALALGLIDEPGEELEFSEGKLIGTQCAATIEKQEYEGRMRPSIQSMGPHPNGAGYRGAVAEPDDEEEEEETPRPKKKATPKKKAAKKAGKKKAGKKTAPFKEGNGQLRRQGQEGHDPRRTRGRVRAGRGRREACSHGRCRVRRRHPLLSLPCW
jgi:hypothetical protein